MIVGINVTPMVDVVLVLLVIMMVSATYIVSQTLRVNLPTASNSDGAAPSTAAVTVAEDGALSFNGAAVSVEELAARLAAEARRDPEVTLVVSADARADHGRVVEVMDTARSHGVTSFAIQVERVEP